MHREAAAAAVFGSLFALNMFSFYRNDSDFLESYEHLQHVYCNPASIFSPSDHRITLTGLGCGLFNLQSNQDLCDGFKALMHDPAATQANFCDLLTEHHAYFEHAVSSSLVFFGVWLVFITLFVLYMDRRLDTLFEAVANRLNLRGAVAA